MSVKTVMEKLTANKDTLIKRSLIVAGAVVGIALTAGLIVKNKSQIAIDLEPVIDAADNLSA